MLCVGAYSGQYLDALTVRLWKFCFPGWPMSQTVTDVVTPYLCLFFDQDSPRCNCAHRVRSTDGTKGVGERNIVEICVVPSETTCQ
mgnify:CR=1 FL=1